MFKRFPVLADLWFLLISQWRCHVIEVVSRFAADRRGLSRAFFSSRPLRKIADLRCGLSDSHNNGRTVARLQCEAGSIIYKPRSGAGESEWFSLLGWMNRHSFQPGLRAARVLRRKGYCWMECIEPASCKDEEAVRRFYQRMGGMIAAAYLLKAVDCHRENVIAAGEYPLLVDVDALWHVSPLTKLRARLMFFIALASSLTQTGVAYSHEAVSWAAQPPGTILRELAASQWKQRATRRRSSKASLMRGIASLGRPLAARPSFDRDAAFVLTNGVGFTGRRPNTPP